MPREDEGWDQSDALSAMQGTLEIANKPPESKRGAWNRFPSQLSEEINPVNILILDF